MFRNKIFNLLRLVRTQPRTIRASKIRNLLLPSLGYITIVSCDENVKEYNVPCESLEHEFFIRQATTVNVNAATQLLTVTLVAIQDTSERLRDALSSEICLVKQALEWGEENTPPQHWDQLVAVRGSLCDLKHNLLTLFSYLEYAEKLATTAAEVSYLSGNTAASDAICERIDHANRTCNNQKQLTHDLQQESLELQQLAIMTSPQLEHKWKDATKIPPDKKSDRKK